MIPGAQQIEDALARLGQAGEMKRTERMVPLLGYLLQATAENPDGVKEVVVGATFFHRAPAYNPRYDAIVRVSVGRLRRLLAAYYEGDGKGDPVRFDLPLGTYKALATWAEEVSPGMIEAAPRLRAFLPRRVKHRLRSLKRRGEEKTQCATNQAGDWLPSGGLARMGFMG